MTEPTYLTPEGAERLKAELQHLKTTAREELSRRLREAISMGDLSENADYHKAKEDQGFLEGRIQELERLLNNAVIVEPKAGHYEAVDIGATVTIQEENFDPETYLLVGAKEADPRKGKISHESPMGKALLGKRAGDVVTVQTPNGSIQVKVVSVQ